MSDRFCAHLQQLFHHDDPAQVQAGLELALALPEPELELLCEGCGLVRAERGGGWLRLRAGRWFHHPEFGPRVGAEVAERVLLSLICRSQTDWAAAQREAIVNLELGFWRARARWSWSTLACLPRLTALRIRGRAYRNEPFDAEPEPPLLPRLELLQLEIEAPPRQGSRLVYRLPRLPQVIGMAVWEASEIRGWERVPQLRGVELRYWRGPRLPQELPPSLEWLGLAGSWLSDFTSLPVLPGLRALRLHPVRWRREAGQPDAPLLHPRLRSFAGLPSVTLGHGLLEPKAPRLETLVGLDALRGPLSLDLDGCHKLRSLEGLEGCRHLLWLRLSGACRDLEGGVAGLDLAPLQALAAGPAVPEARPRSVGFEPSEPARVPLARCAEPVERGRLRGVLLRNTTLTPDRTPDWLLPLARWDLTALPQFTEEPPPAPAAPEPPPELGPEAAALWRLLVPLLGSESPVLQRRAIDLLPRIDAHPELVDALAADVRQVVVDEPPRPWWQPGGFLRTRWEGGALTEPGGSRAWWRRDLLMKTTGGARAGEARGTVVEVSSALTRAEFDRLPGVVDLSIGEGQPLFEEDLSGRPVQRLRLRMTRAGYARWRTRPIQPARALQLAVGESATNRSRREPALEPLPVMPGLRVLDLTAKTTTESIGPWTVQPDLEELHLTGFCGFPGLAQQPLKRLHLKEMWSQPASLLADLPPGLGCLALPPPFEGLTEGWPGTPELVLMEMGGLEQLEMSRLHRVRDLTFHRLRDGILIGTHALPWQLRSLTLLRCPRFRLDLLARSRPPAGRSPQRLEGLHLGMVADLRPLAKWAFFRGLRSLSIELGGPLPKHHWEELKSAPAVWSDLALLTALPRLERLHLAWDRTHLPEPDWGALRALPETTRITMSVPAESAGETWRADGAALCAALPTWLRARIDPGTPLCSQHGALYFDG